MVKFFIKLSTIILSAVFITGTFGCFKKDLVSPSTVVDSTIVAGSDSAGLVNGIGRAARFDHPFGLAIDALGNLYIADQVNSVIRKMDTTGLVTTFAGTGGVKGSADGLDTASFFNPFGVTTDVSGKVYVADAGNNKIRMITSAGLVSTYAGKGIAGAANGAADTTTFNSPLGVAMDGNGNLYIADYENNLIRKITSAGLVSTFAGTGTKGSDDGGSTTATFNLPEGIAADAAGNVYVADNGSNLIRKITPAGQVSTLAGSGQPGSANGTGSAASFNSPFGIAVDAVGNVYVADSGNNLIRKITSSGAVTTFAGSGARGAANATGAAASFNTPAGIAIDAKGNLYVADENNNQIRKITASGMVSTIAIKRQKTLLKLHK